MLIQAIPTKEPYRLYHVCYCNAINVTSGSLEHFIVRLFLRKIRNRNISLIRIFKRSRGKHIITKGINAIYTMSNVERDILLNVKKQGIFNEDDFA